MRRSTSERGRRVTSFWAEWRKDTESRAQGRNTSGSNCAVYPEIQTYQKSWGTGPPGMDKGGTRMRRLKENLTSGAA